MKKTNFVRVGVYVTLGLVILIPSLSRYERVVVGASSVLDWPLLVASIVGALACFWIAIQALRKP